MAVLKDINITDTSAIQLPVGTTLERPTSPVDGYMRFNSDLNLVEYYSDGAWFFMSDIVKGGLILHLDPGNPNCFSSGDTTCKNLVTGGLVTGANGTPGRGTHSPNSSNFPSYSSNFGGVFNFSGGKGMNCEENLGFRSEMSLCMWFYKTDGGGDYFTDARNNNGQWFLSNYTSDNINYTERLTYNFGGSYNSTNTNFLNNWQFMCVTSTPDGSKLYLNGNLISGGSRNSVNSNFGVNFRIGTRYTTSSQWTGFMGPIYAYDRQLSADEVQQNFNITRSRFNV